jgi:acyl-CoA thioesterase
MIDRSRIEQRLSADRFAAMLGIRLLEVEEDHLKVGMVVSDDHVHFHGATHGGAVFSVADCAFSLYSNAYERDASAIDTHMVFTAGTKPGDELVATASEVHRGRTLATYRVLVHRRDGRVAGHFTGTVFISPS